MKGKLLNLDNSSKTNLYVQIYTDLKESILTEKIKAGSRLPSLRNLAKENGVSITTVEAAYNQLLVEGYIESRPKSGYYVCDVILNRKEEIVTGLEDLLPNGNPDNKKDTPYLYDSETFDFTKWKKSMSKVFNDYSHLLQTEADVKGEAGLRYEIAKYLFSSRGVKCNPEQVVIGAGSQQLTTHITRILKKMHIDQVATETPGYSPIQNIFKEEGFSISQIPVSDNGIVLEKLPMNIRTVVYLSPSNQFPTGAVMPIARRYEMINWAEENDSYILEDDYDSELRYFGNPIPAMQGLGNGERVIYLGSFSSTLFSAIKISYMVLPEELIEVFNTIKEKYSQTCSKSEQLCLALYMEDGYYYKNIKKCRRLFANKLDIALKTFKADKDVLIEPINSQSGITITLKVMVPISAEELCHIAKDIGLLMKPIDDLCTDKYKVLSFYFNRVPTSLLAILIKMFIKNTKKVMPAIE